MRLTKKVVSLFLCVFFLINLTTSSFAVNQSFSYADKIEITYEAGNLYDLRKCYLYIPNECNEETQVMVFYPGCTSGYAFPYYFGIEYLKQKPNAIVVYFKESNYLKRQEINIYLSNLLYEVAQDHPMRLNDIKVYGASLGAYTALDSIKILYANNMIVTACCTLDAGFNWNDAGVPSLEDMVIIAEVGTHLYLLEQPHTGLSTPAIADLVESGCIVTILECKSAGHDAIARHAFTSGLMNYMFGYIDRIDLNGEYKFVALLTSAQQEDLYLFKHRNSEDKDLLY